MKSWSYLFNFICVMDSERFVAWSLTLYSASWRAAISRVAIHALVPHHQSALFFLDCFPPASHAVAMTRWESEACDCNDAGGVRGAVAMTRWGLRARGLLLGLSRFIPASWRGIGLLIILSQFIPASWRAAISRAAIHALAPQLQSALFFLDCFPLVACGRNDAGVRGAFDCRQR
jgi:hypothetical protein